MIFFRVLKFTRANPRMKVLYNTIYLGFKDILVFVMMIGVVLMGFVNMGYLLFGDFVPGFKTPFRSFRTCFLQLIGTFDYAALLEAEPDFAPLFFFPFMISFN